jgi:predicted homoserine dehydrogenase-like protein
MAIWQRMEERAATHGNARIAIVGAGFMGRGLVYQLGLAAGMRAAVVVNRTPDHGVRAFELAGFRRESVVVADDADRAAASIEDGRPTVVPSAALLPEIEPIDLVVEATGALDHGARVVLAALAAGKHVVSLNAELDATLGYLLHAEAREHRAVYTIADGDQPGVLLRQIDFVAGIGLEIVAAVNCKRNLDVHQNPDDSRPYAERDGTSVSMTTAFGDGTKMQMENAVVANLTGLVPDRRGMHGVATTLAMALRDVVKALSRLGVVEYTLGGDFGGGVFVIGRSESALVSSYLRYAKVGDGPDFLFFRPYHLMHFEVPITIAEVLLDGRAIATPSGPPVAETIAVAKRDLAPGDRLDGIGGFACYGHVETVEHAADFLPIGLADGATALLDVRRDEPIPFGAVELDPGSQLVALRRRQDALVTAAAVPTTSKSA